MKLESMQKLTADLTLVSGLHIGAGETEIHIGGVDNAVIKHPFTGEPYIPGSSIKGKLRSLLEWRAGVIGYSQGNPVGLSHLDAIEDVRVRQEAENIIRLFGVGGGDASDDPRIETLGTGRLAFWDCSISEAWIGERRGRNQGLTEVKAENTIDRISGTARNPRQTERVPAGTVFDFQLTIKHLEGDAEDLIDLLLAGLKLLSMDSLGGSGSRGYGKIAFHNLRLAGADLSSRFVDLDPFAAAA